MAMLEHRELLSEGQIFQQQATAGAKQASDRHQPKPNNGEHAGRIADTGSSPSGANFLILKTSSILARHSGWSDSTSLKSGLIVPSKTTESLSTAFTSPPSVP